MLLNPAERDVAATVRAPTTTLALKPPAAALHATPRQFAVAHSKAGRLRGERRGSRMPWRPRRSERHCSRLRLRQPAPARSALGSPCGRTRCDERFGAARGEGGPQAVRMERRVMHLRWGWLARRSPEVSTRRYSAPSQCTRRSARPSLSRSTSTPLSLRTLADAHPRTPTHTQERSAPVSEHCGRRSSCSAGRAAPLRCAGSCRHARVSTGDPSLYPTPLPRAALPCGDGNYSHAVRPP